MKILLLSRYARLGASSRIRTMQYLPALKQAGFEVEISPLFDDQYLKEVYQGKRSKSDILRYYMNRCKKMMSKSEADIVWIEYEALPWVPWMFEKRLFPKKAKIVTDYDDAVFLRYQNHKHAIIKSMLGNKIHNVMSQSDLVIVGNQYLHSFASTTGAINIQTIPTVVNCNEYSKAPSKQDPAQVTIGWIGSPSTWNEYILPKLSFWDNVTKKHNLKFCAVGADEKPIPFNSITRIKWTEKTEVSLIQTMDIGIMPLNNSDWAKGKCGYKLIQYMACGLPVIASPVGVNVEIVENGMNGFLAESDAEWESALKRLSIDAVLRREMGKQNRQKVEDYYSLQAFQGKFTELMVKLYHSKKL